MISSQRASRPRRKGEEASQGGQEGEEGRPEGDDEGAQAQGRQDGGAQGAQGQDRRRQALIHCRRWGDGEEDGRK